MAFQCFLSVMLTFALFKMTSDSLQSDWLRYCSFYLQYMCVL